MSQLQTNGFPMSSGVTGALKAICGGIPGGANQIFARPVRFWHRVAYAAAGALQFTFFNVAKTPFVTNFPQAAQLPANYGLALSSVTLQVDSGIDINGARVAAGAQSVAATEAALTLAEELRTIHKNGTVQMFVNDKEVIPVTYGLEKFPPGCGPDVSVACADFAAVSAAAIFNNGAPFWANRMLFDTPYPIAGGQGVRLEVNFQTLLTLTGGGVITAEMVGVLLSPAGG